MVLFIFVLQLAENVKQHQRAVDEIKEMTEALTIAVRKENGRL